MKNETVEYRRAIESLRAGVPNRDVVNFLPPEQENIRDKYIGILDDCLKNWEESGKKQTGLLLTAVFGAGKSHWLEYFRHIALEKKFICSKVVLNKETPLHDLWKFYRACVLNAELPNGTGNALYEIVPGYDRSKAPHYRELSQWTEKIKDDNSRFSSTLYLLDRSPDSELLEKIIAEWTGERSIQVKEMKDALKERGENINFIVTRPNRAHIHLYFEFLSRFFYSRGFAGWVLLVDETEMISRYSVRQRGKAYANLALLLGKLKEKIPGLIAVFTTTPDYAGQMLYGTRYTDKDSIPVKMKGTKDEYLIQAAKEGMKALEKDLLKLEQPSRNQLESVFDKVRDIYQGAYNWSPPDSAQHFENASTVRIRHHIRSWISTWDLQRLYNISPCEIQVEEIGSELGEDIDFQREDSEDRDKDFFTEE